MDIWRPFSTCTLKTEPFVTTWRHSAKPCLKKRNGTCHCSCLCWCYRSLTCITKKTSTPKLKQMQYSHRLSCHRVALPVSGGGGAYDRRRRLQSHSMSVMCHLCISHISLWSSCTPPYAGSGRKRLFAFFKANQSRVYASFFFFMCANCLSELQLDPRLRTRQSEVPQCGLMLSSMYLLSTTSITYFSMRISSAHCIFGTWYISMNTKGDIRTIGCVRGSASQPVADWKCLHLTFGMFFSWHLTLCYFCILVIFCPIYIFSFLFVCICSVRGTVLTRKTSCLSPALIWMITEKRGFQLLWISFCTYHNPNIFPTCLALRGWVLSWRSVCMCESVNITVRVTSISLDSGSDSPWTRDRSWFHWNWFACWKTF